MSALETIRQNKINAEKARALDDMQRRQREQHLYDSGRNDGTNEVYSAVQQEMMRRAQDALMDQNMQQGYNYSTPVTDSPSFFDGLAGTVKDTVNAAQDRLNNWDPVTNQSIDSIEAQKAMGRQLEQDIAAEQAIQELLKSRGL